MKTMMVITKEAADFNLPTKQEGDTSDQVSNIVVNASSCSTITTTTWTRLKDPRIVRVSRALGGKDRHSKVCTVRGLRDRRVRLSVPTAIQLYDLQDRLGFNQPSKVVDWLLNAAKHGIDELAPLQLPPGNFPRSLYPGVPEKPSSSGLIKTSTKSYNKEVTLTNHHHQEFTDDDDEDGKDRNWNENEVHRKLNHYHRGHHNAYGLSSGLMAMKANQSSSLAASTLMMNNTSLSTNGFALRWEPSNLSLSHGFSTNQAEEFHNFNVVPLMQPSSSSSQVLVYPPGGVMQPYFPPPTPTAEFETNKHINAYTQSFKQHADGVETQAVRPFHFSMMAAATQGDAAGGDDQGNKDNDQFQSR